MRVIWDPDKSEANLARRGFDFAFATLVFGGLTLEHEDSRQDYGERRMVATGMAQDMVLTIVYTDRGTELDTERRIISARRSNHHERKAYEAALKSRQAPARPGRPSPHAPHDGG